MSKTLGQPNVRLRAARQQRRWTIEKASEAVGASRNAYHRWEQGLQQPNMSSLNLLCEAFGMSPEELGFTHLLPLLLRGTEGVPAEKPSFVSLDLHSQAADLVEIGTLAFALAQQHYEWSPDMLHIQFERARRRIEEMTYQDSEKEGLTRRQALTLLSNLPVALLGLTQKGSTVPLFAEELLPLCATSIPACWELYYDGGKTELERVLPVYLSKLSALAEQPSLHQKEAASFASQAYQLACILAKQQESFGPALDYSKRALIYARLAEDPNLQVATLIQQGDVFFARKRPVQTLQSYQETLPLLPRVFPLLRGRVYAGLAEACARRNQKEEAEHYMGMATENYPDHPEQDPAFLYSRHTHYSLYVYGKALAYLNLGQPKEALQSLVHVEKEILAPTKMRPQRVDLMIHQAATCVALGDLEQSCFYTQLAATSAQAINSHLRYNEAFDVYEHMQERWGSEKSVEALADLFKQ